jgi:hypothetical protein
MNHHGIVSYFLDRNKCLCVLFPPPEADLELSETEEQDVVTRLRDGKLGFPASLGLSKEAVNRIFPLVNGEWWMESFMFRADQIRFIVSRSLNLRNEIQGGLIVARFWRARNDKSSTPAQPLAIFPTQTRQNHSPSLDAYSWQRWKIRASPWSGPSNAGPPN